VTLVGESNYWFDEIFEEAHKISDISYSLLGLARAFERIGNTSAYEELSQAAGELLKAQKLITRCVGTHISEDFKQSEKQTALVVRAALAGIALERR